MACWAPNPVWLSPAVTAAGPGPRPVSFQELWGLLRVNVTSPHRGAPCLMWTVETKRSWHKLVTGLG